jgi:lipoate-protein ligase A
MRLIGERWCCEDLGSSVAIADQLARETAQLQELLDQGGPSRVFLWSCPERCIVASRRDALLPGFRGAVQALADAGTAVHTRVTGGGACPQGPGVLNISALYAIAADERASIEASYQWFCGRFAEFLDTFGLQSEIGARPGSFCDGRYNVLAEGKKLIGTAQRWKRNEQRVAILGHALLLLADAGEALESVRDFYALAEQAAPLDPGSVTSLEELGIDPSQVRARLGESFDGTGIGQGL